MMLPVLTLLGFIAGLFLFLILPDFDPLAHRKYSTRYAPLIEEVIKFSPALFGYNPIPFAFGFALFEIFQRREEKNYPKYHIFVFHILATSMAYYYQPLGIIGAITLHYFVNRRASKNDLNYIIILLIILVFNKILF